MCLTYMVIKMKMMRWIIERNGVQIELLANGVPRKCGNEHLFIRSKETAECPVCGDKNLKVAGKLICHECGEMIDCIEKLMYKSHNATVIYNLTSNNGEINYEVKEIFDEDGVFCCNLCGAEFPELTVDDVEKMFGGGKQ